MKKEHVERLEWFKDTNKLLEISKQTEKSK